jgi:hypothetical protein
MTLTESFQQMQALKIHELESQVTLLQSLLAEERAGDSRRCVADGCNDLVPGHRLLTDHSTCSPRCVGRLLMVPEGKGVRHTELNRRRRIRVKERAVGQIAVLAEGAQ